MSEVANHDSSSASITSCSHHKLNKLYTSKVSTETSTKLGRALILRDRCTRDIERYCKRKQSTYLASCPNSSSSYNSPSVGLTQVKSNELSGQDIRLLLRKFTPGLKNVASTNTELLHYVQSCRVCATRSIFCKKCEQQASQFFHSHSSDELLEMYGDSLPPPNRDQLKEFFKALEQRMFNITSLKPKRRVTQCEDKRIQEYKE